MENNKIYKAAVLLAKLNKFVYTIEKGLLIAMSYGLVLVLFINVLFRFVLFIPSPWSDELGRYIFIWLVFLGSAAAMYNWEHIDINLIDSIVLKFTKDNAEKFEKIMWLIKKFAVICSILYLSYLLVKYKEFLKTITKLNLRSMFLGVSLIVPMSAVYFCSILMIFHGVCYLIIPETIHEREV